VSSKGTSDSIWKLEGDRVTELWNASDTRVVGGPSIARDGRRIAFTIRRHDGRTLLSVVNLDGTDARIVPTSLEIQGAPAWAPTERRSPSPLALTACRGCSTCHSTDAPDAPRQ
jgi:hypothetical protein